MNSTPNTTLKNKTIQLGIILLLISFVTFASTINIFDTNFDLFTNVFFFHYGLTIIYLIAVLRQNKKDRDRYFRFPDFTRNVILLQLFNISAYSLNRTISVFNISTNWLVGFLFLSNILLLVYVLWKNIPFKWLNHLIVVVSNLALLLHLYESFYVGQVYLYGVMAFWFFGIPLHIFVPLLFVWVYIKIMNSFLKKSSKYWTTTLITWAAAIGFIGFVSLRFHQINSTVNETFHLSQKPYQDKLLPEWITTAQQLKNDWITKRALKVGIVYSSADRMLSGFGGSRLNERIKHDPVALIASFFNGEINIPYDDKIKILNSMFDTRHQTERKLWSGENLSTSDIVTNIQLFPDYRLAYTEKTFKIKYSETKRWNRQQEALYTFNLPEGSVVTSAALWIEGKEEPAYLTTKTKADSAYTRIVGRERRDPLLLHWKEGNRVTVRIFPCTPDEDRQFKIGVTTPLKKLDNQLVYENIDFQGPYWKNATESINIVTEGSLSNISTPYSFKQEGTNYSYIGPYQSNWNLTFDTQNLSEQAFSFNGKSYHLEPYEKKQSNFDPQEIYLDINKAWTRKELKSIETFTKNKKVFVYANNRLQLLTENNKASLYDYLQDQNFGLFPFYKIQNPEQALVISKFSQETPTLSDLKETGFMKETSSFFNESKNVIRLFNLGTDISSYLKTLKELRSVQVENGTLDELTSLFKNNTFYQNQENDQSIVNPYADFKIIKSNTTQSVSTAPDHLMRLFAYNDLLRDIGKNYFNMKTLETTLIDAAKEAYVVTPVSSLIVLETQKDYDRFNIEKSKNSLQNASIGNSGAVPEPHEWVLILLVLMMTLYFYFRK